jgi:hypothetical protein
MRSYTGTFENKDVDFNAISILCQWAIFLKRQMNFENNDLAWFQISVEQGLRWTNMQ